MNRPEWITAEVKEEIWEKKVMFSKARNDNTKDN